jgi:hypothetical protein
MTKLGVVPGGKLSKAAPIEDHTREPLATLAHVLQRTEPLQRRQAVRLEQDRPPTLEEVGASLEDGDRPPALGESARCRQPGNARADDHRLRLQRHADSPA